MTAKKQRELIKRANKYLKYLKHNNIKQHSSSLAFLSPWAETPGYAKLSFWAYGKIKFLFYIKTIIKNILLILKIEEYKFYNIQLKYDYNYAVFSYARKDNFLKNGSYFDDYFKTNSRDCDKTIWILLSQDNYLPKKLDNNITIIYTKKINLIIRTKFFFRLLLNRIKKYKYKISLIVHDFTILSIQAELITKLIRRKLDSRINSLILPYEAHPLHLSIYKLARELNKDCNTIGYIHASIPSFPIDSIYRKYSPKVLLVHGYGVKDILTNELGWKAENIKVIESLRYRENFKEDFSKKILMPYSLTEPERIINNLFLYVENHETENLSSFRIRMHPQTLDSNKHIEFKKKLEKIIKSNRRNNNCNNKVIIIGSTSSVLLALELGYEVVHIVQDPLFEIFYPEMWQNISSIKINNHIYKYKLKNKNSLIKIGKVSNRLDNYLGK